MELVQPSGLTFKIKLPKILARTFSSLQEHFMDFQIYNFERFSKLQRLGWKSTIAGNKGVASGGSASTV
jgi:hypothetical protein